jgi:hypothetical protein
MLLLVVDWLISKATDSINVPCSYTYCTFGIVTYSAARDHQPDRLLVDTDDHDE